MKSFFGQIFIILCLFYLNGCGISDVKSDAEDLWSEYFTAIQLESFQEVLPLYSNEFYKKTPRDDWVRVLKKIQEKLGNPESYQQVSWKVQAQAHRSQSGTVVILVYDVQYSKYDAREKITVFKPASGGEALIVAHNINSKEF